jgi:hypothetical protein
VAFREPLTYLVNFIWASPGWWDHLDATRQPPPPKKNPHRNPRSIACMHCARHFCSWVRISKQRQKKQEIERKVCLQMVHDGELFFVNGNYLKFKCL